MTTDLRHPTEVCEYCGSQLSGFPTCPGCGALTAGAHGAALTTGTRLRDGQYEIERVLGRGGFAITYLARDLNLQAAVAVKELFPADASRQAQAGVVTAGTVSDFARLREHLYHEAQILLRLRHPGIVRVLNIFDEHGTSYLVMEYLLGETLGARLARSGRLAESEAVRLLDIILSALADVHASGLLHRDLKPDNIMLTASGPVLIDFGTALDVQANKTMALTSRVLTPEYAPLEQYALNARLGPPTDIYALCATFYEAISGVRPIGAAERVSGANALAPLAAAAPGVSPRVAKAIDSGLSIRVLDRPQSALALSELLKPESLPAPPAPTVVVPFRPPPRRSAIPPFMFALASVAVVLAAALALRSSSLATPGESPSAPPAASAAPQPAAASPPGGTATDWRPTVALVQAFSLYVHEGPGLDTPVLKVNGREGLLHHGEQVTVDALSDRWDHVVGSDFSGWVRSKWLTPLEPQVSSDALDALKSALASGGELQLSTGVYLLDQPLTGAADLTLVGAGTERTVLLSRAGTALTFSGAHLNLRDLTLASNGAADGPVAIVTDSVLDLTRVQFIGGSDSKNDPSGDSGDGLAVHGVTSGSISGSFFMANRWRGLSLNESSNLALTGNWFSGNGGTGLAYFDASGGAASGNTSDGNTLQGIKVMGSSNPTLINNDLVDNIGGALRFSDQAGGEARANTCEGAAPAHHVVWIAAGVNPTLDGNKNCQSKAVAP